MEGDCPHPAPLASGQANPWVVPCSIDAIVGPDA